MPFKKSSKPPIGNQASLFKSPHDVGETGIVVSHGMNKNTTPQAMALLRNAQAAMAECSSKSPQKEKPSKETDGHEKPTKKHKIPKQRSGAKGSGHKTTKGDRGDHSIEGGPKVGNGYVSISNKKGSRLTHKA